jgi:hypothetical protein
MVKRCPLDVVTQPEYKTAVEVYVMLICDLARLHTRVKFLSFDLGGGVLAVWRSWRVRSLRGDLGWLKRLLRGDSGGRVVRERRDGKVAAWKSGGEVRSLRRSWRGNT